MESDPVAMRYWSRPPMREMSEAIASRERARTFFPERTALRWSVTRPEDDRALGQVSLFAFVEPSDRAEIGYGLARRHWGATRTRRSWRSWTTRSARSGLLAGSRSTPIRATRRRSVRWKASLSSGSAGARCASAGRSGTKSPDTAFFGLLAHEWKARRNAG